MNNKDFSDAWSKMMSWTPCMALFEDIDTIFNGRENIAVKGMENGVTFDGFLNGLDGVENTDGIFIIITTNSVEAIDFAIGNPGSGSGMSTRPGRIDKTIEFTTLDERGQIKMAKRIMSGFDEELWSHIYEKGKNDTGAQFQERCCRLALRMFWESDARKKEPQVKEKRMPDVRSRITTGIARGSLCDLVAQNK
jgi:SpoVK/Ycf46/Vps4 family AAA+-type ATPase